MARPSIPTDGAAIRRTRQLAGYTGREFAELVSVSVNHLYRLERGTQDGSPSLLRRIALATGKRVIDFVAPEIRDAA